MPSPVMWSLAVLFGIPALYDLTLGRASFTPLESLFNLVELAASLFLLFCAVRACQGKRAALESRRVILLGHSCIGLLVLCFLAKVGMTAARVYS